MKIFDPAEHPELRNLFPELTPVQFETAFLFSLGRSQKEIAELRSVAYKVVRQAISQARCKFETKSLAGLIAIVQIRVILFALYFCQKRQ